MYTLFETVNFKTGIFGYWYENKKLHRDNIKKIICKDKKELQAKINQLFKEGQKAVFYIDNKKDFAYCFYNNGVLKEFKQSLKIFDNWFSNLFFRKLLHKYGGLTCTQLEDCLQIEVYF